ncbi:carbohydrate ABC transporter permease [Nocardia sp. NPDC004711]
MALLFILVLAPCAAVLALAFFSWDPLRGTARFVGMDNFVRVLTRADLLHATVNTVAYTLITVPTTVLLGLAVALAIHHVSRGGWLWRTAYFMPIAATLAATSVVWKWLFYPRAGVIDSTIGQLLGVSDWLNSSALALPAVGMVGCWQGIGSSVVMFLAGLATIPDAPQEAARLDGANAWQRFHHVTWPALGPAAVFAVVIALRDSLQVYDQVRVMTNGGPMNSSVTLAYLMWKRGITYLDVGGASVVSLVLLALVLGATWLQLRLFGQRWESAGTR